MKRLYIVGSSSKVAKSIERITGTDYDLKFFGRSNPLKLKEFTQSSSIDDELSVNYLSDQITNDFKYVKNLESASLVILSGVSSHDWRESYLVNEYLPAKLSEAFAKKTAERGINGSIVLVSSTAAYHGSKLAYATTKASLAGILHTIAGDFRGKVRINIVLPGAFDSGMISDWSPEKRSLVAQSNLIGRLGTADDIADAILFAVNNPFITNSIINMSGGTVGI